MQKWSQLLHDWLPPNLSRESKDEGLFMYAMLHASFCFNSGIFMTCSSTC